jgi:LmbE family N-acetylglucosaminyl deacetylase
MSETHALEHLPEDWTVGLAVVAHPDDMEYGASAAVAKWTNDGKQISYLLLTAGEAGIDSMAPAEAAPLRIEEQRRACDAVGVSDLEILDFPDGLLEYGIPLRRAIAKAIRRVRPEVVFTINHRDEFGPGRLNMADHVVTGRAVIDAVRDAANRWVFTDEGESWSGVRWIAVAGSPRETHGVVVDEESLEKAVASLAAHRVYLDGLGSSPMADPDGFLRPIIAASGARMGTEWAVSFEVFSL